VLVATAVFGAGIYWNDASFRAGGGFDLRATETILLEVARHQLPTAAGMMLLAGALAIIFSTATTFLIVPSTNLTRDVYQRFVKPDAEQSSVIGFQRWMILGLAVVSFLITNLFPSILDMALYAYTMVGAAVTPALLAAFLWRRVTPKAGTFSVAAGMVATLVFGILNQTGLVELSYDYIIYPAGAASILSLVVVSYLTPPSSEEQWRPFWPDAR